MMEVENASDGKYNVTWMPSAYNSVIPVRTNKSSGEAIEIKVYDSV